eukprot:TRINITY_DN3704_c0_g1_i1.p1 TRINITY_DN3704_c0_g1~~TRINITY_DN3704_c0_g1_i1.p1  ORF type:complete len:695 (+),score=182.86 TRINITY_DN3704_c0_g1_i1:124-2085(+)
MDDAGVSGLDPANMDTSVAPSKNFFRFANGTWMDTNPVPGEYPAWNTFTALHDANLGRLKALLEELPKPTTVESLSDKVSAFWHAALDEEAVEKAGIAPLAAMLACCDSAHEDKTAAVAKLQAEYGVNVFFAIDEGPDDKQSEWTLLQMYQGGLGLPDRDYYFDTDKEDKRVLYLAHVKTMLTMLGDDEARAEAGARAVVALETTLARSHLTLTEKRDPETRYNKMRPAKLKALCKGALDWEVFFEQAAFKQPKHVNVDNPVALAVASRCLEECEPEALRAYCRFHVAKTYAAHLPKAFVDANFEFYSRELSGQKEQKPRWKRAMAQVEGALGEAVGELYVAKHFAGDAKARALAVVEAVRAALETRLNEVPWMSAATRTKALEKMNGFGVKIGFPDKWIDYSSLEVRIGDHLGNVQRSKAFEHKRSMGFADASTDKTRWLMLPQQINAYYHPNLNEIVFPAAILQPPFFDATADEAVNFGSFGAVVGHEMTHGFDDQGRQYDSNGNLNDWWVKKDGEEYERRVAVQVEQAAQVRVHGKELNGKLTCGENIADLGGLRLSYRALSTRLAQEGEPPKPINGFSAHQRFFLAWAQVWRENTSKEHALKMLALDPHGPNEYRTNGPLSNMPEFHAAFGVTEGTDMYVPEDKRVDIW